MGVPVHITLSISEFVQISCKRNFSLADETLHSCSIQPEHVHEDG